MGRIMMTSRQVPGIKRLLTLFYGLVRGPTSFYLVELGTYAGYSAYK